MEIAGKIMAMHHQEAFREIIVDEIGIGAGVVDRLKEQGAPVRGLNVAAKSSDDMYFNKRSEVWFNMADWLKYGSIPKDYELMADLTAPQYRYESNGKYRVEKKDETKKRLGRSPDRADAVILAVQATAGGRIGMW
jgi:phage terminase large subunit